MGIQPLFCAPAMNCSQREFLINGHSNNLQLLKVNKAVDGYSNDVKLSFSGHNIAASCLSIVLCNAVSKRKMPNSGLASTSSYPLSKAGGLYFILCLSSWRLWSASWIWLLSSLRLSISYVLNGNFLPVVAIKICNKHNWDVYSISAVSSCQIGLYDTDFYSNKTSLIREIKH